MPSVFDPNAKKEDEDGQTQHGPIGVVAPKAEPNTALSSTGGGTVGSNAPTAPNAAPPAATKGTSSGSFTDLRKYMEANRGGTQAMAGGVAGKVEGEIGQTNQAIGSAKESSIGDIGKAVQAAQGTQQTATGAVNAFTGGTNPPATPKDFESTLQAGLGTKAAGETIGKTGLSGEQGLIGKAQHVEELGSNLGNQSGVSNILKSQAQGTTPNYTAGMNALDTGLLGANQIARQRLAQAGAQAGTVRSGLEEAKGAVGQAATTGAGDIKSGYEKLYGQLGTSATSELDKLKAAADAANIKAKAAAGEITPDEAIKALNDLTGQKISDTGQGTTATESGKQVEVSPGVFVKVDDLIKGNYFTGAQSGTADVGNIDPAKLAMINVMSRLGGGTETAGTGAQFTGATTTTANPELATKEANLKNELANRAGEFKLPENKIPNVPKDLLTHIITNTPAFMAGAAKTSGDSMSSAIWQGSGPGPGMDANNAINLADKSKIQQLLGPNSKDISQMNPTQIKQEMIRTSGGDMGHVSAMMKIISADAVQRAARQQQYDTKQGIIKKYFSTGQMG